MILNPIKFIRHRERLRHAIEDETFTLHRIYGDGAYDAAMEKLKRTDLTSWGREVVKGAAKQLRAIHDHNPGGRPSPSR